MLDGANTQTVWLKNDTNISGHSINDADVQIFTYLVKNLVTFCGATPSVFSAATWVAIVFVLIFLVWMLGCCSFRAVKESRAAKTWPVEMARATGAYTKVRNMKVVGKHRVGKQGQNRLFLNPGRVDDCS